MGEGDPVPNITPADRPGDGFEVWLRGRAEAPVPVPVPVPVPPAAGYSAWLYPYPYCGGGW